MTTVYAIGHSTRSLEDFIGILQAHGITVLTDIRTVPKSRHNPQFSLESLEQELPRHGIQYRHLKDLGGLRHARQDSINTGWENASFRGYADHMQSPEFEGALGNLIELAGEQQVAIMCAEGNPFRCHRSLVADALTVRGATVLHISSCKSAKEHRLTPFAHVEGTRITYPPVETS